MKFKPKFSDKVIEEMTDKAIERVENQIYNQLQNIGLEFISNARINADFTDHTGNLRSSIGYVIAKNGKVLSDDFELSKKGTDRETGRNKGVEFALAKSKSNIGFVLVVVAGMEYAAYVESKGKDVITGSSLKAEKRLLEAFERV